MTKTWLWFRVESNTESKNGRKFRPDTETKVSKSRKKKYVVLDSTKKTEHCTGAFFLYIKLFGGPKIVP